MQLSDLTVELRPRTGKEAIDLGLAFWRQHLTAVLVPWVVVVWSLAALLFLLFHGEHEVWAMLLLWWLKPLYDRVPLYVYSRAVFGETPGWRQTLREFPRVAWRGLLPSLLWRRLSLARSFLLPVWQLEGLSGRARATRAKVLTRRTSSDYLGFLLVCWVFEAFLWVGGIILVGMLAPALADFDLIKEAMLREDPNNVLAGLLSYASYVLAMTIIEPFYVAGGFSLYLARRTQLEAWDLEVAFRRLGARLLAASQRTLSVLLAGMVLAGLLSWGPEPAWAACAPDQADCAAAATPSPTADDGADKDQVGRGGDQGMGVEVEAADAQDLPGDGEPQVSSAPAIPTPSLPPRTIQAPPADLAAQSQAVANEPIFRDAWGKEKRWVLKQSDKKSAEKGWLERLLEWLMKRERAPEAKAPNFLGGVLALVLKWVLIVALVVLIGYVIYKTRHVWSKVLGQDKYVPPEALFGLDVRAESLPDSPADEAWRLWQAGERRASLALLYRAALVVLMTRHHVELEAGDTEGDCVRRAQRHLMREAALFFERLTADWLRLAYAHSVLDDAAARALCDDWRRYFGPGAAPHEA